MQEHTIPCTHNLYLYDNKPPPCGHPPLIEELNNKRLWLHAVGSKQYIFIAFSFQSQPSVCVLLNFCSYVHLKKHKNIKCYLNFFYRCFPSGSMEITIQSMVGTHLKVMYAFVQSSIHPTIKFNCARKCARFSSFQIKSPQILIKTVRETHKL